MTASAGRRNQRHPAVAALLAAGSLFAGAVVGFSVLLAVARHTDRIGLALAAGGLAELAVAATGVGLTRRRSPLARHLAAVILVAWLGLTTAALLVPLPDQRSPALAVPGEARWQLASGLSIRYVHIPAVPPVRPVPVVFLHGGPGVADLAGDAAYFGRLAADGYDVYVYDQAGAGASTRLIDPTRYTIDRDVTDLEEIRHRLGADSLVLIGHSYGGVLAAHYLAAHPERVSKVVLLSPGALDPTDTSAARATAGTETYAKLRAYAAALAPRALTAYALLQVNPDAAHAFFGDAEADARNDKILGITESGLHCPGKSPHRPVRGTGFYRLQYPQSAAAVAPTDIRPRLAGLPTPALIVKGSCDYLSWRSARDYTALLPHATLVYLPGAGHNVYQDRPADVHSTIRAFLTGGQLPIAPYHGSAAPSGYQND